MVDGADASTCVRHLITVKISSARGCTSAAVDGDKISLVAGVTADLTDRVKAGDLMREFAGRVGGKGGGRPDMAQGGGTDVTALKPALADLPNWVAEQLN